MTGQLVGTMRGGCLLAIGARRTRGSNKFSSVRMESPWILEYGMGRCVMCVRVGVSNKHTTYSVGTKTTHAIEHITSQNLNLILHRLHRRPHQPRLVGRRAFGLRRLVTMEAALLQLLERRGALHVSGASSAHN